MANLAEDAPITLFAVVRPLRLVSFTASTEPWVPSKFLNLITISRMDVRLLVRCEQGNSITD